MTSKKLNAMGKKVNDEKKWGNHRKLFSFVVGSHEHF
jgi:hypothetical protein